MWNGVLRFEVGFEMAENDIGWQRPCWSPMRGAVMLRLNKPTDVWKHGSPHVQPIPCVFVLTLVQWILMPICWVPKGGQRLLREARGYIERPEAPRGGQLVLIICSYGFTLVIVIFLYSIITTAIFDNLLSKCNAHVDFNDNYSLSIDCWMKVLRPVQQP